MLKRYLIATTLAVSLGAASTAQADSNPFGLRLGITDDPDTVFFGAVWEIGIAPAGSGEFVVEPGFDLGLGLDDPIDFTLAGSAHFKYLIPVGSGSYVYPLFGPMLYYVNFDDRFHDDGHLDVGINVGGGFRFDRFEIDLWLGIEDVPDIAFAFTFRL